jgi:RNA ligase (TIGR02306 family)
VFLGSRSDAKGVFPVDDDVLEALLTEFNLKRVPVLYKGPYSKEVMLKYTDGLETYSGKETHIREGLVVEPLVQRRDPAIGRVVLKSVSTAYLSRKGGTELN